MHAFVELMNFTAIPFVEALRSFLQSFRLPGEAQKIDRFMLKFADQYVKGNPTSFESAGTFLKSDDRYPLRFGLFSDHVKYRHVQ
jgi:brefeldin A-inhibited guanine nucleotide-exchange protein